MGLSKYSRMAQSNPLTTQPEREMANIPLRDIKAGMRINVLPADIAAEPMIRTLTFVGDVKEHGKQWRVWKWKPEQKPDGRMDCGYGGIAHDAPDFESCEFSAD